VIQVAFATHDAARWTDDDKRAAAILEARGVVATSAVWDDPSIVWSQFACVVIRSTWDYHLKVDAYADWLRRRANDGTNLWNPPHAVLANLNKRYLSDLSSRGVPIVPTKFLPIAAGQCLRNLLLDCRWDDVVIKPAISAGAHGAWRTSLALAEHHQAEFERQASDEEILVQPYMREIASSGEWSLVFFDGDYSHAVLKRPSRDDFRVQQHLGGSCQPATPSLDLIKQARDVLAKIDAPLLYARVDGVVRDGVLFVMEVEINEPYLFLGYSDQAPGKFAEAILRKAASR
jgi:glutathione synthase/RimK-type ligase-like ATP-grasp enzyme